MRSQTIASKILSRRVAPLAAISFALVACGNSPPASSANDMNSSMSSSPPPSGATPALANSSSPIAGDVQADAKRNKFDEEQAKVVLARAATNAHTCVDVVEKDQPHGEGSVTVTFSGKGKSTTATIAAPFEGTPMGQCVTRAFVNMIVPPFEGPDVDMTYPVNLKPDAKGAKKDSAKPKK